MVLSNTITFNANPNFSGEIREWNLNGQDCWNHDNGFNDRANSVDTHGTCVRCYKDMNCQGDSNDFKPGSAWHNDLSQIGFGNAISSCRNC